MYPTANETEKGVRHLSNTILLFAIVAILTIVITIALIPILISSALNPGDFTGFLGAFVAVIAGVCILLAIALIACVLGLLALLALNNGKAEFGPDHAQKVERGILVAILGIVIPLAAGLGFGAATGVAGGTSGLSPLVDPYDVAVSLGAGVVGALLMGLFLRWTIERLGTPETVRLGTFALLLGIASPAVAGGVGLGIIYGLGVPPGVPQIGVQHFAGGLIGQGLSVVSLLLWWQSYRIVLARFQRGELRGTPPPMPAYPTYATPYPAYPTYPQAPPPAPPQGPPPGSPPPP